MTPPPDSSGTASGDPLFTVVITTHNRPALCDLAIASLRQQTLGDFECVVVDDCGAVGPNLPDDTRFRLVRHATNRGLAAARNTGAREARGSYITFLDDDDRYDPDRLWRAHDAHASHPIAVCWSLHDGVDRKPGPRLEGRVHDRILDQMPPHCGATSIARDSFVEFDESYMASQDIEWWLRQSMTGTITTIESFDYLMGLHTGVRSTNSVSVRIACQERLLRDHAEYFRSHPRARAFRLYRLGMLATRVGQRREARRYFGASLRARPSRIAIRNLARSFRPESRASVWTGRLSSLATRSDPTMFVERVAADQAANNRRLQVGHHDPILRFLRLLRAVEFLDRASLTVVGKAVLPLLKLRLRRAGEHLGFTIPRHVFDEGLALVHIGTVVVTPRARVGPNCRIHQNVTIGQRDGMGPTIGADVWIGPGAVIYGDVRIGDGAKIGANAVVGSDVPAGALAVGNPARISPADLRPR